MPPAIARYIAVWFGCGKLRPAPGTWGSAAALPLAWGLWQIGGNLAVLLGAVAVFAIGIQAAEGYCRQTGKEDPSEVVVDEVAGQLLALAAVTPSLPAYAFGFLFFRVFDILKPGPIGWADRRIKGGLGVMADDMLAGLMAGVLLFFLGWGSGWWTTI